MKKHDFNPQHPFLALFNLFKKNKSWSTSNFLKGLFTFKILISIFTGWSFAVLKSSIFVSHSCFLLILTTLTRIFIINYCNIDVSLLLKNPRKIYFYRLLHSYIIFLMSHQITKTILKNSNKKLF